MTGVRDTLLRQLDTAWKLASHHLDGLSTEECLWRPARAGLHVQPDAGGRWRADWPAHEGYDLGPPSIAWITWHIGFWWSMALDHSFGAGTLARETVCGRAAPTPSGGRWGHCTTIGVPACCNSMMPGWNPPRARAGRSGTGRSATSPPGSISN